MTAVNNGSGAVTITGWGITAGGGANIVMINPLPESKPLPHRLEGGSDAKFYIPADHVKAQHLQRDVPYSQMRPWVRLATGREVVCRRGVPMRD
ncbi:hypothetical protein [Amnibacterium sp.]|uniref:hypothetical protein n=1 Tax=Amnibacterium sp. TaxID=1872496 RepID=UPI003F7C8D08